MDHVAQPMDATKTSLDHFVAFIIVAMENDDLITHVDLDVMPVLS